MRASDPGGPRPLQPGFLEDPYPYYARFRAEAPVHLTRHGFWLVTRYSDVCAASNDPRFSNDLHHYRLYDEYVRIRGGIDAPALRYESNWLSLLDPPRHTRLRKLISQAFKQQVLRRGERLVEAVVDSLLGDSLETGEMDLVVQFAHPLSVSVMCYLLGVPLEDHASFLKWAVQRGNTVTPAVTQDTVDEENRAVVEFAEYFRRLAKLRRRAPEDDLVTALTVVEDKNGRLTEEEVVATCLHLLSAGHLPMAGLIGNALFALLRHPDELAKLRANPPFVSDAIEELARYDSPAQAVPKVTTQDVALDWSVIPKGEIVMLCLASANRDPLQFTSPDDVNIAREPNRHVAFGQGVHFCLGARLGRLEARIALSRILERVADMQLGVETPAWQKSFLLRGLLRLPVRVRVRSAS